MVYGRTATMVLRLTVKYKERLLQGKIEII